MIKAILQAIDRPLRRSFEEAVVLFLSAVTVGFLVPFVILRALAEEWLNAGIDVVALSGAISIWIYVWRTGRTAVAAPLWSFLLICLLIAIVQLFGTDMLFWAYPLTAATFFLVRPVLAAALSGAAAAAIAPQAINLGGPVTVTAFYPSLLATNVLALAVVIVMNRNRSQLKAMAERDVLTQLPNRVLLGERLEELIVQAGSDGCSVGVFLLDLDEFKLVNDTLGHGAGDELLRQVAMRLRSCARMPDTVARFGGDEFVVAALLERPSHASRVAERLAAALTPPCQITGSDVAVRASIGISLFPEDGTTTEGLLQAADTAMYAAKRGGRNQYCYFDKSMNHQLYERLQTESELRQALESGQLVLHFQPRVALATGATVGVEALVRWQHPSRGLVLPEDFLRIAEQSALIREIDRYVLKAAARQAAIWRAAGHDLLLSVNLSARELHHDGFGSEVAGILTESGADPASIELEITESTILWDYERATRQLHDMRERAPGLRIAMDDFGTGYSSLQYLRQLPIDTLKIDRNFVADLTVGHSAPTARAIVRTIIELGHHLDLLVAAEGVEEAVQLDVLGALGCDEAQGFWYTHPLPIKDFEDWIIRNHGFPARKQPRLRQPREAI